ncbi:MAG: hypothetical protein ACE14P_02620 [Methanotrichaceae archaeon]
MISPIKTVLGIMLLVSAVAALGSDNNGIVMVNEQTMDMLITGANVAQMSDINANLMGNDILANQATVLMIEDGCLTGLDDGRTNAIQVADLMINDIGSTNIDTQFGALYQDENNIAIGNITQVTGMEADDIGCGNSIDQSSSSSAGNFFGFIEPNMLTNSDLGQASILNACVDGSANNAVQGIDQFITYNTLTDSEIYEQAKINANILGNENNPAIGSQGVFQNVDSNLLTGSSASQVICLDEQSTGCFNDVSQLARPYFYDNALTSSTSLQSIDLEAAAMGAENVLDQNADLLSSDNNAVVGHLVQITDIINNS